jgi:flagellar hook assembly protein FlgD
VELGVYDLGGRLVRSLKRGMLPAGAQRFEWDGRDSRGREVAGGIYFVKLHAERVSLEAKLVKLR